VQRLRGILLVCSSGACSAWQALVRGTLPSANRCAQHLVYRSKHPRIRHLNNIKEKFYQGSTFVHGIGITGVEWVDHWVGCFPRCADRSILANQWSHPHALTSRKHDHWFACSHLGPALEEDCRHSSRSGRPEMDWPRALGTKVATKHEEARASLKSNDEL
jgi:hypothetical protein